MSIQYVRMGTSVCKAALMLAKVVWRCVMRTDGARSVMMVGALKMHKWPATSLDLLAKVTETAP